jgi:hypothetical protein
MSNDDETDDSDLTSEQLRAVALLTATEIDEIDSALLSNVPDRWRKVAFVIGKTMSAHKRRRELRIPDGYYAERVRGLVERGLVESVGNLRRMRFSEIRRLAPKPDPDS